MKDINIRTDLAIEAREMAQEEQQRDLPGVKVDAEENEDIKITRVKIDEKVGEEVMGKPMGTYITLEIPQIRERGEEFKEDVAQELSKELSKIIQGKTKKDPTTLVVGLGNRNITPDALGPKVVSHLMVTRHLLEHIPDMVDDDLTPVCAISPGVLGITGIET